MQHATAIRSCMQDCKPRVSCLITGWVYCGCRTAAETAKSWVSTSIWGDSGSKGSGDSRDLQRLQCHAQRAVMAAAARPHLPAVSCPPCSPPHHRESCRQGRRCRLTASRCCTDDAMNVRHYVHNVCSIHGLYNVQHDPVHFWRAC